jgi:hypothetical protein
LGTTPKELHRRARDFILFGLEPGFDMLAHRDGSQFVGAAGQAVHIADDAHDLLEGALLAGGFLILVSDFACLLTIGCAGGTAMEPPVVVPEKCAPEAGAPRRLDIDAVANNTDNMSDRLGKYQKNLF